MPVTYTLHSKYKPSSLKSSTLEKHTHFLPSLTLDQNSQLEDLLGGKIHFWLTNFILKLLLISMYNALHHFPYLIKCFK